jgi:leucyl/phenylalanyl-tRNA--protein transferase
MPIFPLTDALVFPDPKYANPDGILAIGGDLRAERLLLAYEKGIFPWYSKGQPILWWSPDPRFVLWPEDLKVAKSMRPILNQGVFQVTYDQAFEAVISHCQQTPRPGQHGTWITGNMLQAYHELHQRGLAHSVEVWQAGDLVGGLYGVSIGDCFFGESMFTHVSNASKAGFITLMRDLRDDGIRMIDCQVYTQHLESLGAAEIPRAEFLHKLRAFLAPPTRQGNWGVRYGRQQLNP